MTSLTRAGLNNNSAAESDKLVDAIDQVFVLFRVNYHNQYYKAFPDKETLFITKKLWLKSLRDLPETAILKSAEQLVRGQDYLPTLSQMLRTARVLGGDALPDVHTAFVEACQAPSPKKSQVWSHPLVYHAGYLTGWHTLSTQPERLSFPLFRRHFEKLEQSYLAGQALALPEFESHSPPDIQEAVDTNQARRHLAALKSELDF